MDSGSGTSSLVSTEGFSNFVRRLLPGLLAVFPWFALFTERGGRIFGCSFDPFWKQYGGEAVLLVLLASSATMSMFLDEFGSHIESEYLDRRFGSGFALGWNAYLKYGRSDTIGHRYLRTLVLALHFELQMIGTLIVDAFGVFFGGVHGLWGQYWPFLSIALMCMSGYFLILAGDTHQLLAITRHQLLDQAGKAPRKLKGRHGPFAVLRICARRWYRFVLPALAGVALFRFLMADAKHTAVSVVCLLVNLILGFTLLLCAGTHKARGGRRQRQPP